MNNVHEGGEMQEERSVVFEGMLPVSWPISYASLGNRHFLSKGIILGVTASRFHVAGTMSVEVGMRPHLWGGPPAKPGLLSVRATVVWIKEREFGLDFHSLGADEREWLTGFLTEAQSQSLLPQAA